MTMNRIEVHQDGGRPEVLIDGQPIACRRVTLRFEVGCLPQVEIEPSVIRGDASLATTLVRLDPVLAALLEAYGWAPPKKAESITDGGRVSRPGPRGDGMSTPQEASGASTAAAPTQGHQGGPVEPAPAGWGPQSVPSAAVLARLAQEQDVVELGFELRLLKELRREDVRRADAMAAALGAITHKPEIPEGCPLCEREDPATGLCCGQRLEGLVHRTPAVVQARLDAEATP